jgi:peptide deformylase
MMESCGSVEHSDLFAPVLRSKTVIVKALWADNIEFDLTADGLLARVIQHEIDHLNGILFTEKISDESKRMTAEEYNNLPA